MHLPSAFSNALQSGLQKRQQQNSYFQMSPPAAEIRTVDFGSNDSLSIRASGLVWSRFLSELEQLQDFFIGAGGSRVIDGSNEHIVRLERILADFHHAEEALFFNSGYEANVAIYSNLPQKGDAIIHDDEIHASIHDGIRSSRASIVKGFAHNDTGALGDVLEYVKQNSPGIVEGKQTVFIALESFYSMEGDMAPIREILCRVKRALPAGNAVLIVDEAHSTGLIGPHGSGYINHLGLEKECIIQMQSYGKAAGALGGVLLCNSLIKQYMANYARALIYSTGPSFPTIATILASVNTIRSPEGEQRRQQLRSRVQLFHDLLLQHPNWKAVSEAGILKVPTTSNTNEDRFLMPIIPIMTGTGLYHQLQERLYQHRFRVHALPYHRGHRSEQRIRFMMHAENTPDEIREFVRILMEWGWEKFGDGPQARL